MDDVTEMFQKSRLTWVVAPIRQKITSWLLLLGYTWAIVYKKKLKWISKLQNYAMGIFDEIIFKPRKNQDARDRNDKPTSASFVDGTLTSVNVPAFAE